VLPGQDFFLTETVYLFESCCAEQGIDLLQAKITKAVLKRLLLFVPGTGLEPARLAAYPPQG